MPFVDARELSNEAEIRSDVCIVGAGPAGIAIALSLRSRNVRVILLESGGYQYDPEVQSLAKGASIGVAYPDLVATRLRFLGGTTNHWGGNVKALDPIDFEERWWLPHSGWPLDSNTLRPYYAKAKEFLGLPSRAFQPDFHAGLADGDPWRFESQNVENQVFHTVGAGHIRVGERYRSQLAGQSNLDVLLHATATRIATDPWGRVVGYVELKTLSGKKFKVRSRAYVLAAGGIENARLLLASNDPIADGLGNGRGLVGRYFMEHLTSPRFADFYPRDPVQSIGYYKGSEKDWGSSWGVLAFSAAFQRQHRIPNIRFQLSTVTNKFNQHAARQGFTSAATIQSGITEGKLPEDLGWHVANVIADIDEVASAGYYRLTHRSYPLVSVQLVFIAEQAPNFHSRVFLGTERDALGVPCPVLDWRLTRTDNEGVLRATQLLANQVGQAGLGRVALHFDNFDATPPRPHIHHMGTTRMSETENGGVVDPNCRVHGVSNLFVAGSSVFPTSGNVNPTLTILALAFRIAEHLKGVL